MKSEPCGAFIGPDGQFGEIGLSGWADGLMGVMALSPSLSKEGDDAVAVGVQRVQGEGVQGCKVGSDVKVDWSGNTCSDVVGRKKFRGMVRGCIVDLDRGGLG